MIRGLRRPATGPEAARLAALVRARFALPPGAVVIASELGCRVPGCPPLETVVLVWDESGARHRLKVFRPLAEVGEDDLPPRWYLPALRDEGEPDCGCC
jgi:nitrate reductase delta subunit